MENNCLFSNYRPVTLTTLSNKKYFLRFRFTKCSNDHFLVRTRRLTVSILDARWRTRMKLFRDPSFSSPVSRSGWRYWDCSKVGLELEDTRSATLYKRSRKPLKFLFCYKKNRNWTWFPNLYLFEIQHTFWKSQGTI